MQKKTTSQLMNEFMRMLDETSNYNHEELVIIYENLTDIVRSAKEQVIKDAEEKMVALRIMTLGHE